MERHPNNRTTDEQIDAALERAKLFDNNPRILEAVYNGQADLEFLMLRLDNGRRLLIPREELPELRSATIEQAADIRIGPNGIDIYWPQLDDGLYLPEFLADRWHSTEESTYSIFAEPVAA